MSVCIRRQMQGSTMRRWRKEMRGTRLDVLRADRRGDRGSSWLVQDRHKKTPGQFAPAIEERLEGGLLRGAAREPGHAHGLQGAEVGHRRLAVLPGEPDRRDHI